MLYRIDFRAMGCQMTAMLDSPEPEKAAEMLRQLPHWFEEWEQAFSRFRPESELSRLNKRAGWPMQVSEAFWDVFQAALEAEKASGGLVRATVLKAVLHAGYDRSFDEMPSERISAAPAAWGAVTSLAEVEADAEAHTLCLPADVQLDFGGVAKGWAAMQAAQRLAQAGPALVSAGGDMAITQNQLSGERWPVTVDEPFQPGEYIATLGLGSAGLATSGTDYRRWKQNGQVNHHIIDPRSGLPAQTDILSATLVAPDAVQAEMAAKTTLILGSQAGMEWMEERPEFAGFLALEGGKILHTRNMEQYFWRKA